MQCRMKVDVRHHDVRKHHDGLSRSVVTRYQATGFVCRRSGMCVTTLSHTSALATSLGSRPIVSYTYKLKHGSIHVKRCAPVQLPARFPWSHLLVHAACCPEPVGQSVQHIQEHQHRHVQGSSKVCAESDECPRAHDRSSVHMCVCTEQGKTLPVSVQLELTTGLWSTRSCESLRCFRYDSIR